MDLESVKSALSRAGNSIYTNGAAFCSGVKEYAIWGGHKVAVGAKAAWTAISAFFSKLMTSSAPYAKKAVEALSSKAGLISIGALVVLGFAKSVVNGTEEDKIVNKYILQTITVVTALAVGILVAQAGLVPVII